MSPRSHHRPTVGVATLAWYRRSHLERQARAVARAGVDDYAIIDLGGPPIDADGRIVAWDEPIAPDVALPLAAARNRAVRELDTDVVVLLDVDVIPGPDTIERYRQCFDDVTEPHRTVVIGPVGYLAADADPDRPVAELVDEATVQPGRPRPGRGVSTWRPWETFWSLSFATTRHGFHHVGGFDERYVGYGGEDTDFAFTARAVGMELVAAHGAVGVHQFHPVSSPPTEHVADIVANARRFRDKWGIWPMRGWLEAFAERGAVRWSPAEGRLEMA